MPRHIKNKVTQLQQTLIIYWILGLHEITIFKSLSDIRNNNYKNKKRVDIVRNKVEK